MSPVRRWADIATQNQTLLTQALEKLAAVERDRDIYLAELCQINNDLMDCGYDIQVGTTAENVRAALARFRTGF